MEQNKSDQFYADLEARAKALLHPPGRAHPVEWARDARGRRFLGVSTIVKGTAAEYATRIIEAKEDDGDSWWGEQGNTLAERHLSQLTPYRENQVRIAIPDVEGWDFVGHMDGATVVDVEDLGIVDEDTDFRLVINEAKHQDPDEGEPGGNVDRALRQAILYGAMAQRMFDAGDEFLLSSDLMPPGARLAPCAPVHGISLHFWGRTGPCENPIKARAVPMWEFAQVLDRYLRKARHIIASVAAYEAIVEKANDEGVDLLAMEPEQANAKKAEFAKAALACEGGACEWDFGPDGCVEFKFTVSAHAAGLPNDDMLLGTLKAARADLYANRWDVSKRQAQALVLAKMAEAQLRKVTLSNPDDADEIWAAPTFRSNQGGTTWLTPNLRGAWDAKRLEAAIEAIGKTRSTELVNTE